MTRLLTVEARRQAILLIIKISCIVHVAVGSFLLPAVVVAGPKDDPAGRARELMERYEAVAYDAPFGPTVGFEIEGQMPVNEGLIAKQKSVVDGIGALAQSLLGATDVEVRPFRKRGLSVSYQMGGRKYQWGLTQDSTVKPTLPGYAGFEIVSPIIYDPAGLIFGASIMMVLSERFGLVPEENTAGLHVHVGFERPQTAEIGVAGALFERVQDDAYPHFGVSQQRERFAAKLRATDVALRIFYGSINYGTPLGDLLGRDDKLRYRGMNTESLAKRETMEFRFFNSTMLPLAIIDAVVFSSGFVRAVRSKAPIVLQALSDKSLQFESILAKLAALSPLPRLGRCIGLPCLSQGFGLANVGPLCRD